jgi:uncharacterized protein DUF4129
MTEQRRRLPVMSILVALPLGLAVIAEAAWISVVAGLVQEYALRAPTLGIFPLVGFASFGVLAARLIGPRLGDRWPLVAAGLCLAGGAVGWLNSAEALASLRAGALGDALAANPAGWLAAVAIARGFAHARLPLSEATLGNLLGAGVPGLAFAAIIGGMVTEPFRGQFLRDAIVASIAFATSATLALALTRLAAVGADSGFDWRRNPWWVGLLTMLVLAAAGLAILASSIAAPAIAFAVGAAIGPLLLVAVIVGFNRRTLRIVAIAVAATVLLAGLITLFGSHPVFPSSGGGGGGPSVAASQPAEVVVLGGGLLLVIAVIVFVLLARLWMQRIPLEEDDVLETRMIDRGDQPARMGRIRRRRRGEPVDAVTAYLALVDDLAARPDVRRNAAETPAEHARRLREAGGSAFGLDLLAADYALVRFAAVTLSGREDRRAVARWRALRRQLGQTHGGRGRHPESAD